MTDFNDRDLKEAFDLFDTEKTGTINIADTIEAMKIMNFEKDNPAIFDLICSMGDGDLDYQEFKDKFQELIKEKQENRGLERLFYLLLEDPNKENIDLFTLQKAAADLGETFSELDFQYILDSAGNGEYITYDQFIKFMERKI